jgi:hypothetical protein
MSQLCNNCNGSGCPICDLSGLQPNAESGSDSPKAPRGDCEKRWWLDPVDKGKNEFCIRNNQGGGAEPGSDEIIATVCSLEYGESIVHAHNAMPTLLRALDRASLEIADIVDTHGENPEDTDCQPGGRLYELSKMLREAIRVGRGGAGTASEFRLLHDTMVVMVADWGGDNKVHTWDVAESFAEAGKIAQDFRDSGNKVQIVPLWQVIAQGATHIGK